MVQWNLDNILFQSVQTRVTTSNKVRGCSIKQLISYFLLIFHFFFSVSSCEISPSRSMSEPKGQHNLLRGVLSKLGMRVRTFRPSLRLHNSEPKINFIFDTTMTVLTWKNTQKGLHWNAIILW